jgi:HAD superfamily hydrolase (TIGR01509 family)
MRHQFKIHSTGGSELAETKAVFFDWMGTVAHPEPDRHELFSQLARELGVELSPQSLLRGVMEADTRVPEGAPPRYAEGKDEAPFLRWWEVLLARVEGTVPKDIRLEITRRTAKQVREATWVLYDDVLPAMKALKEKGLALGLISNMYLGRAGLDPFLNVVITAKDVGAGKPDPLIFRAALKRAGVAAKAAIYVGDQYELDVVGARKAGIRPILIDRYDLITETPDCPVIQSLSEVLGFI